MSVKRSQSNESAESLRKDASKVNEERKSSPQYGRPNAMIRPVTATAMTRLCRATAISAHRHSNWKAHKKSNDLTLNKSGNLEDVKKSLDAEGSSSILLISG